VCSRAQGAELATPTSIALRRPAPFLDRDGVINYDSDQFIKSPDEWRPIPGSLEAISRLNHAGFRVVVATNHNWLVWTPESGARVDIPMIAIDIPHPGAIFYGANNYEAGLMGGRHLGRWAKESWHGVVDEIILIALARAGSLPRMRLVNNSSSPIVVVMSCAFAAWF
jgi:hypothetical protein